MRLAHRYLKFQKALLCLIVSTGVFANAETDQATISLTNKALEDQSSDPSQYTFAWQFLDGGKMAPRGGTTTGPAVELDLKNSSAFNAMTAEPKSTLKRDRAAIMAMAGEFRTTFDFIETVGFVEDYEPQRPYQSWGTEYVFVVEQTEKLISLQHILVMKIILPSGEVSKPIVMKHWRQDWTYEPNRITAYAGKQTWHTSALPHADTQGRWLQSVYQVDDSPRYQALGTWSHFENYSSWLSDETWRPLPRREFSVRNDYDVLIGTNRHTINPTGWVQEEENLKVVLNGDDTSQILAKEIGLARYQRISNWDWGEGKRYWSKTAGFWAEVRRQWRARMSQGGALQIKRDVRGTPLFAEMFRLSGSAQSKDLRVVSQEISEILDQYIAH